MLPACMCACFYVHLLRCFSLDILSNLWVCVGESYLAVVDDEEMTTGRVVKSLSKRLVETVYTDSPVGVLLRSQPFPRVCYQLQIYCIKQREIRSRISFTRFIVGRSNYQRGEWFWVGKLSPRVLLHLFLYIFLAHMRYFLSNSHKFAEADREPPLLTSVNISAYP